MKTLTFICVLVVSVSVYAKTEAGLKNVEGFGKKRPQRDLAASAVNDMGAVLAQLDKITKPPKAQGGIPAENMGFSGNTGALTKPKKSAVPKTADSTK